MIIFVLGTTAEAIKLKHLWQALESDSQNFKIIDLGQHSTNLTEICQEEHAAGRILELRKKPYDDLSSSFEALTWFFSMILSLTKYLKSMNGLKGIIVQGDTLSTLIGTLAGKLTGLKVIHIEAGLRSFNLAHPFPEEITRRLVSKISYHNFSPSNLEVQNLLAEGKEQNEITETFGNTSFDNLPVNIVPISDPEKFIVVTLHRHELLSNKKKLKEVFIAIKELSAEFKIYLFLDSRSMKISEELWSPIGKRIITLPKMPRENFLRYLLGAEWVLTDSGGLQEECAYYGIPTLVFRKATERFDRVDENIYLAGWNCENIFNFSKNYRKFRVSKMALTKSPSKIILEKLKEIGILA